MDNDPDVAARQCGLVPLREVQLGNYFKPAKGRFCSRKKALWGIYEKDLFKST